MTTTSFAANVTNFLTIVVGVAFLGVTTIGDARELHITSVEHLGNDILLSARPTTVARPITEAGH